MTNVSFEGCRFIDNRGSGVNMDLRQGTSKSPPVSATFRDVTGAKYPKEILGNKTKPPLGKSLLPIFKGEVREPHKEIYWHFSRANAVRQGDLKVVRAGKSWELYDLKADPTETNNLAKERPEKTAELAKMWEAWRQDYKNKPK